MAYYRATSNMARMHLHMGPPLGPAHSNKGTHLGGSWQLAVFPVRPSKLIPGALGGALGAVHLAAGCEKQLGA